MVETLALKYRPASFADLIGQKLTAVVLDQMIQKDEVPQGLFFVGSRGSGKTSSARILGNALGGDIVEIDAASNGTVADVRVLIDSLRYSSGSAYRVVIIDECHSMSREAFNALLKTLEEPPAGTIFILVTTEPEKVPETVKDRLMEFVFNKVTAAEIFERLVVVIRAESIQIDDALIVMLAERADGSVRDALMSLDQISRACVRDVPTFLEMVGEIDVAPELISSLMTGDAAQIFASVDKILRTTSDPAKVASQLVQCLRDLLVVRAGGIVTGTGTGIEKRKELTLRLEPERILEAMKLLWDLKTKIRASSDARSNLDLVLILIAEVFTRGKEVKPPVRAAAPAAPRVVPQQTAPPRRLSLSEL